MADCRHDFEAKFNCSVEKKKKRNGEMVNVSIIFLQIVLYITKSYLCQYDFYI